MPKPMEYNKDGTEVSFYQWPHQISRTIPNSLLSCLKNEKHKLPSSAQSEPNATKPFCLVISRQLPYSHVFSYPLWSTLDSLCSSLLSTI